MGEDVIGGGALRQEIDPSLTLANVTQPGVFERTSRKSFTTTPVNPNLTTINPKLIKKYWGEYSQQIQVMKNDPIVGRIMSGMSDNDIIKYMMRDLQQRGNFSDFYRLAAERAIARKDRTPDLSTNGAIEILNDSKAVVDNLVPDKVIQKKIIDDREIFTAKKAESLLKGQEVPTLDISLDSLPGMPSASDIALGYQKGVNAGFRAIAKPESSLFRSPYGTYYGNQAVKLIVENAKRNSTTTIYTVPSATESICSTLAICNRGLENGYYDIAVRPNGAALEDKHYITFDALVGGEDTVTLTLGISIDAADVIQITASNPDLSVTMFGNEIA